MTRRANLPGADELFRSTAPALSAVPAAQESNAPLVPPAIATPKSPSVKKVFAPLRAAGSPLSTVPHLVANAMMRRSLSTYQPMSYLT